MKKVTDTKISLDNSQDLYMDTVRTNEARKEEEAKGITVTTIPHPIEGDVAYKVTLASQNRYWIITSEKRSQTTTAWRTREFTPLEPEDTSNWALTAFTIIVLIVSFPPFLIGLCIDLFSKKEENPQNPD